MVKVIHIITSLGSGGAEKMLYKLLRHCDLTNCNHEVISLMDEGIYGGKIKNLGIKVHCLNLQRGHIVTSVVKAAKIIKKFDIVNTWLYHADIFGFVVGKIMNRKKLVWNIRHCNLDKDANKPRTLKIVKLNSFLSNFVDVITYNSQKGRESHIAIGYKGQKDIIIPNGFELNLFYFDPKERTKIRRDLGIQEETLIITVGRWDIQKDYHTLIAALVVLQERYSKFKMLMVGSKLDPTNQEIVDLITKNNLISKVILLGRRNDIPALLSAADIYVSSSLGESFSNSIGEAMACELPCVVTDVGDSKLIVGDTGIVVKPQKPVRLAFALLDIVDCSTKERCTAARGRIIENYDIIQIVKKFESVWQELCD